MPGATSGKIVVATTKEELLEDYLLEEADILACIAYGAEMARERYVDVPLVKTS